MPQLISPVSRAIVQITARRIYGDGTEHGKCSTATGFFWRSGDQFYLVTNWHNVTGLNAENLEPIGTFYPSHLDLAFRVCVGNESTGVHLVLRTIRCSLYDGNGQPNWIEHLSRRDVDLVAIQFNIQELGTGTVFPLNDCKFANDWKPDVGADAFVVGFPEGFSGPLRTPIWKRASIASEPNFSIDEFPFLVVDTIGNQGLSGSPVLARASGIRIPNGSNEITDETVIGTWENLIGVYAGRMDKAGIGSQLGRVWKVDLIDDLLRFGIRGHHPSIE